MGVLVVLLIGFGLWQMKTGLNGNEATSRNKVGSLQTSNTSTSNTTQRWTNSLGMVFVPVPGIGLNFSICRINRLGTWRSGNRRQPGTGRVYDPSAGT